MNDQFEKPYQPSEEESKKTEEMALDEEAEIKMETDEEKLKFLRDLGNRIKSLPPHSFHSFGQGEAKEYMEYKGRKMKMPDGKEYPQLDGFTPEQNHEFRKIDEQLFNEQWLHRFPGFNAEFMRKAAEYLIESGKSDDEILEMLHNSGQSLANYFLKINLSDSRYVETRSGGSPETRPPFSQF